MSASRLYAELKRRIKKEGLMDWQPAYYAIKFALTFGLLALRVVLVIVLDNPWLQMFNAEYMAFVFGQISLPAHD